MSWNNEQPPKKAVFIVAPANFRDEELFNAKNVLDKSGVKTFVSSDGVPVAKGSFNREIKVDVDITELNINDYDAIIFIGGYGAAVFLNDDLLLDIAKKSKEAGKIVCASGLAVSILANSGILMGVSATCASSEEPNLRVKGAYYNGNPVTIDEKIITSNGPESANDFGDAILHVLGK